MTMTDASSLAVAGKFLIVGYFIAAGINNLFPARIEEHLGRLGGYGVPMPRVVFWLAHAVLFTGCALILADWRADVGVMLLVAFTAVANALYHRFWNVEDPFRRNMLRVQLMNGFGTVGGLLLLLYHVAR
jgi:uncharacterized membrane protein YphA (DoxX/SURF4 family)